MDIKDKQRGARLEALRSAKGISQIELAKKLGYKSDSTISKWEAGMSIPTGGKLVEIAKLLSTTTDYILFGNSNIVLGDNNGVNGLTGGSWNTNTYNFGGGCSEKQDNHNDTMKALSVADMKMSRALLNAQTETNKKLEEVIALLEKQNRMLEAIKKVNKKYVQKLNHTKS